MRIAMGVEYDGSAYHGWQLQISAPSIQQQVEAAISRVADHPVQVVCAGRTDTGVHATQQVIHFDTAAVRDTRSWVLGVNTNLPGDIVVLWAKIVDNEFHARFKAISRIYRYVILNRFTRSAVHNQRVTWFHKSLDTKRMQAAANDLIGEHDFTSYRAMQCQAKSPIRTVHSIMISQSGDCIYIDIHANAFLHHMVRNITGVLLAIGHGDQPVEWAKEILAYKDRTLGGVTAPPYGLYLAHIEYPVEFQLPIIRVLPIFA